MSRYWRDNTPGATWFFTVVTHRRQRILGDEPVRDALREAIARTRANWPFAIDAWVLLPDHLHCIWTLPAGDADFATRWTLIKRRTSQALKETYFAPGLMSASKSSRRELTFWQRRYWEHRIRDEQDFERHVDYIHYNPVKHGYAAAPASWPYSSFHRYVRDGLYPAIWGSGGANPFAGRDRPRVGCATVFMLRTRMIEPVKPVRMKKPCAPYTLNIYNIFIYNYYENNLCINIAIHNSIN